MKCVQAASAVLVGSVILIGGCASTPTGPSTELTSAKAAIDQAERAGAREYATESLNASVQKMDEGQAATAKGDYPRAKRLLEESYADAHLAQISAQSAKSSKDAADVDQGIHALQSEASRPGTP
jgi:Domain of unknown function (DUF4398)